MREQAYYRTPYGEETKDFKHYLLEKDRFLDEKLRTMSLRELFESLGDGGKRDIRMLLHKVLFGRLGKIDYASRVDFVAFDGTIFTHGRSCKEYEDKKIKEIVQSEDISVKDFFTTLGKINAHHIEGLRSACIAYAKGASN